jgi:hypothetical protein
VLPLFARPNKQTSLSRFIYLPNYSCKRIGPIFESSGGDSIQAFWRRLDDDGYGVIGGREESKRERERERERGRERERKQGDIDGGTKV